MLMGSDEDDTNSIKPTGFDRERLTDLLDGEEMAGEYGNYRVLRYKVDDYVVLLSNHPVKSSYKQCGSLQEVVDFLNS
jgi:hypothetical protein